MLTGKGGRSVTRWAALLLAVLLSASPTSAKTLRAADNQLEDYPTVQALMFLDRYVREHTAGRQRIQIFHSGQLGDERNTLEQTKAGAIDLDRVNITPLASMAPVANVLLLPFLFRSVEHMQAVLDGPIGEEILSKFESVGLIGLTFYDSGARSFYNDVRPIRSVADMAGLRIRVQPSELMTDFVTALGAKPVQLPYGQVLAALQTKLIDGAENNWPSYVSTGHFLASRYLTETRHIAAPEVLVVSRATWETFTPEDRALFREAALASKFYMRQRWRAREEATRRQAIESGSIVTTDFDRDGFVAASKDVREKYLADPQVRDLADRIGAVP